MRWGSASRRAKIWGSRSLRATIGLRLMRASRLGVEIRFLLREQTAHPRLFQASW